MPLFWEQNKQCFSSVSRNAPGHSHPLSLFLNPSHLSANTPPYLLIYTDADLNTCTHTHALVANVVSAKYLCQFLPALLPVISLLQWWTVGQLTGFRQRWFVSILVCPFSFGRRLQHVAVVTCIVLMTHYGATWSNDWAMSEQWYTPVRKWISSLLNCFPPLLLFVSTFHPPPFTQIWILSSRARLQFQLPWLSG